MYCRNIELMILLRNSQHALLESECMVWTIKLLNADSIKKNTVKYVIMPSWQGNLLNL